MTQAARTVLEDCRGALEDFNRDLQGEKWRRHWILCVTLLRAVGSVLEKVDGKADPKLKAIIDHAWKSIKKEKSPHIFLDFIEEDRNLAVKVYQMRAGQGVIIDLKALGGEPDPSPPKVTTIHIMTDSPYKCKYQHDMIQSAIDWWQDYLDKIDASYQAASSLSQPSSS